MDPPGVALWCKVQAGGNEGSTKERGKAARGKHSAETYCVALGSDGNPTVEQPFLRGLSLERLEGALKGLPLWGWESYYTR